MKTTYGSTPLCLLQHQTVHAQYLRFRVSGKTRVKTPTRIEPLEGYTPILVHPTSKQTKVSNIFKPTVKSVLNFSLQQVSKVYNWSTYPWSLWSPLQSSPCGLPGRWPPPWSAPYCLPGRSCVVPISVPLVSSRRLSQLGVCKPLVSLSFL